MRISFVISGHAQKPGGGNRIIYTYASLLARRGHDVAVTHAALLAPKMYLQRLAYRREVKNMIRGALDLVRGSASPAWFDVDPAVELRYVAALGPGVLPSADATVATAWRTADVVAAAPASAGVGFYFIQHHEVWDAPAARVDATWRLPLHKIVIASWLERVAADLGVQPVRRIPNAIDLDRFRVVRSVEERPPRVAMLWSSAPVKGGDVGLRAIELARAAVPELEAVLFGVGAPPARLPDGVTYRRNPPQDVLVEDIYNGSAIYLCPSWSEGWHLPPAEAMACGCAVVSTSIDGVADYARNGETALLADPGDAEGLADHIVALVRDPARCRALAARGFDKIVQFDWKTSTDLFEQALVDGTEGRW